MAGTGIDDWTAPVAHAGADDWGPPPGAPRIAPITVTPQVRSDREILNPGFEDPMINGSGPLSAPNRIIGAGVEGFGKTFGSDPLGIEMGGPTDVGLRKIGLTLDPSRSVWAQPATAVTDFLIRGLATAGDAAFMRGIPAVIGAGSEASGQFMQETGAGKVLDWLGGRSQLDATPADDARTREEFRNTGPTAAMFLDAEPWARQANEGVRGPLHATAPPRPAHPFDPEPPPGPRGPPPKAPQPGTDIGLTFPNGPSRRATVGQYFDNGESVRLHFDNGQVHDYLTADVVRDMTEPPPPVREPTDFGPAVTPVTEAERMAAPLDDWQPAGPSARRVPSTPELAPEALTALDQAHRLERDAVDPRSGLTPEARQDAMMQAAKLRRTYGVGPDGAIDVGPNAHRHPLADEPAADLGPLAAARAGRPEAFEGQHQHPLADEPADRLGPLAVARVMRPDLYEGQYVPAPRTSPVPAGVDPAFVAALDDVSVGRAGEPKYPSFFDWIRHRFPEGIRSDPEVSAVMKGYKNPRFKKRVMSPDGASPDMVREAAKEDGWFGRWHGDENQAAGMVPGDDIGDLYDLLNREANGDPVYHPDSGAHAELHAHKMLDEEFNRAGIQRSDPPEVAARKLADFRKSAEADALAAQHEARIDHDLEEGLDPQDQERLQDHGYEPGADIGEEYQQGEGDDGGALGPQDHGVREEDDPRRAGEANRSGELPQSSEAQLRQDRYSFDENGIRQPRFIFDPPGTQDRPQYLNREVQTYVQMSGVDPKDAAQVIPVVVNYVAHRGMETGNETMTLVRIGDGEPMALTTNRPNAVRWENESPMGYAIDNPSWKVVSVHNHPTSTPFSNGDISMFAAAGHEGMIVIGHDGTWYGARRRATSDKLNTGAAQKSLERAYIAAELAMREAMNAHVKGNDLYGAEAGMLMRHSTLEAMARSGIIDYMTSYAPDVSPEARAVLEKGLHNATMAATTSILRDRGVWVAKSNLDRSSEPVGFRDGVAQLLGGPRDDAAGPGRGTGPQPSAGLPRQPAVPYRKPVQLKLLEKERRYRPADYQRILESQRSLEGLRAAMRDSKTGKIYTGWTHQQAIDKIPHDDETGAYGRLSDAWDRGTEDSGFVDRDGKFISRDEANRRWGVLTMEDVRDARANRPRGGAREDKKEYTTEPGAVDARGRALPQTIMPGMEHSAQQAAKAREAADKGRLVAKKPQKEAGPLFGPGEGDGKQGSLFEDDRNYQAPPFFSALTHSIEAIPQNRAPASQWSAIIDNLKNKGVKQDEISWSGVKEWLAEQKGPVAKSDLLQHLRDNEVQVKEVESQDPEQYRLNSAREHDLRLRQMGGEEMTPAELDEIVRLGNLNKKVMNPKYASYALPGGKNYRELLLTMPERAPELPPNYTVKPFQDGFGVFDHNGEEVAWGPTRGGALANAQGSLARSGHASETYRSGHWDEPNVLAHIRFDDRTGPNGEKILHVAEIQSDWHQNGRKSGYRAADTPEILAARDRLAANEREQNAITPGVGDRDARRQRIVDLVDEHRRLTDFVGKGKVPDAPFKSTWHELAMKRILRYASEHGYDKLTWDTGETAADRFDLSKQVSRIDAEKMPTGNYSVEIFDKDGKPAWAPKSYTQAELAEHVGKDMADKIVQDLQQTGQRKEYRGLDLKAGGTGMRGFYDRILPQFVNKYAKKWGAKVDASELPGDDGSADGGRYDAASDRIIKGKGIPVHSVDITPAMRDSVMQGQGLFEDGRAYNTAKARLPENMDQAGDHIDNTADAMAAELKNAPPGTYERTLRRMPPPSGPEQFRDINVAQRVGTDPRVIASLDTPSARFWNGWKAREATGQRLLHEARNNIPTFLKLDSKARDKVYAVEELDRVGNHVRDDDGRSVVARNDGVDFARKSKPGESIRLTPQETKAYFERRKMFRDIWGNIMEGAARRLGWDGAWGPDIDANIKAIRDASTDTLKRPSETRNLQRIADVMQAMGDQRRSAYVPLMRHGSYFISVTPKVGKDTAALGGHPETKWFELVERPAFHDIIGAKTTTGQVPGYAQARIDALRKQFGDGFNIEHGWLHNKPDVIRRMDIPAVEKLLTVMEGGVFEKLRRDEIAKGAGKGAARTTARNKYDELFGAMVDEVRDQMYEGLKAGFKKRSKTVPGYSEDFDRATGSYMHWTSHHVAEQLHGDDIENAYNHIQDSHPYESIKQYWQKWRAYQDNPSSMMGRFGNQVQHAGFLWTMAANPSSSAIILLHGPEMAIPTLSNGVGMKRAGPAFGKAMQEVLGHISFDSERGAFIDRSKIGKTPAERALIAAMDKEGHFHSTAMEDMRGLNDKQSNLWGKAKPVMRRALDIASSNIAVADQANRIATALAAHRLASDPAVLRLMDQAWRPHNQIWRDMVDDGHAATPEKMARFMVSEGAGEWGRANRAAMTRGVGQSIFFLHGFQKRILSAMWKFGKNTGPSGKIALAWMLGGLWAGAGIQGEPFVQDAENAADTAWQYFTGHDPMIGFRMQETLADLGFGKVGAEVLMHGPVSTLTGVDLADRIGLGDPVTKMIDDVDVLGTMPSIMINNWTGAQKRLASHQPAAALAGALPAGLRNPAMAQVEKAHGVVSQSGKTHYMNKNKITPKDTIVRSLGFKPLDEQRAYERNEWLWRAKHAKGTVPKNLVPD